MSTSANQIQTSFITQVNEAGQAIQSALRVAFASQGDRMAHVIALVERIGEEKRITPLVASIEGTESDVWPPSSPLQSLSIEQRPTGDVALLVGMAGRSHWSASFETFAHSTRLVIEHACRFGGEPAFLGSSYRILNDLARDNKRVTWMAENLSITDSIRITAPPPSKSKSICWKYELQIIG